MHSTGQTITHGLPSGPASTVDLSGFNFIGMTLRHGSLIDQISFVGASQATGILKVFGPFGGNGGAPSITFGNLIRSFYGRKGHGIDQLGGRGEPIVG